MAFIVLSDKEGELERRELLAAITIGRSPDCDVPVRDMLLSRVHCRIEPHGRRWVLIDAGSMNGTRISEELIGRHILENGDVMRIGRTYVCFREGPFVRPQPFDRERRAVRPLEPSDAMSATVAGVELKHLERESPAMGFPTPQPKPAEPKAFQEEGVGSLVAKMASGVWDTRMLDELPARRAARKLPHLPVGTWEEPAAKDHVDLRRAMHCATRRFSRWPLMKEIRRPAAAAEPRWMQAVSNPRNGQSRKWLVLAYLVVASAVFATAIYMLAWQFL